MKKKSKRYKNILKSAVKDKKIELKEIIDLVKKNATTKFDESIDVSLRINLKQSKGGDLSLRSVVKLPNGSGKKSKVAVLCEADKVEDAKKSGADIFGSDDLLEKISLGKLSKFKEDSSLLSQGWVMDPKKKLSEILKETDNSLKILDFKRLKIGEGV